MTSGSYAGDVCLRQGDRKSISFPIRLEVSNTASQFLFPSIASSALISGDLTGSYCVISTLNWAGFYSSQLPIVDAPLDAFSTSSCYSMLLDWRPGLFPSNKHMYNPDSRLTMWSARKALNTGLVDSQRHKTPIPCTFPHRASHGN